MLRVVDMLCGIGALICAAILAFYLMFIQGAFAQEIDTGVFCDTEDEVTAVFESDDLKAAVGLINKTDPSACMDATVRLFRGKKTKTVRSGDGLIDIVPILIVGVGDETHMRPVPPLQQWAGFTSLLIESTWKPEFKDHSVALKYWFENASPTEWVMLTYGIYKCCMLAERVKTKFTQDAKTDEWMLQCNEGVKDFCAAHHKADGDWLLIPPGIIHEEKIEIPVEMYIGGERVYIKPEDAEKVKLEFQQLWAEGVLFVYKGDPVCFWAPESDG